ncbi:MAG: HAD hydrolase-like protein [Bacteroidales bacterium]|nr:HAD hydrolase-like protein [Bacteroidales bacterium]
MYTKIKVIGFDADDTLWVNEPYFRDIEDKFCQLLKQYLPEKTISKKLLEVEISNLKIYGYGVKGFILSLIETALKISADKVDPEIIEATINLGKELLNKDIILLDGVTKVLENLSCKNYKLIVATKGDLLDQERKLKKSGLEKYFHHIEVMSDKTEIDYRKLLNHLDVKPSEFVMIGNSLKSDILPLLNIGCKAIHIPFHTTWEHENISKLKLEKLKYNTVDTISQILNFFPNEKNN